MVLRVWRLGCGVALALACFLLLASGARAATIRVNTELDEPLPSSSQCSLRGALNASNNDLAFKGCPAGTAGHDAIIVPGGLYGLSSTLQITGDVTISGAGALSTVVSQGGSGPVMTMFSLTPAPVTLDGLTLTGGHAFDGGNGTEDLEPPNPDGNGAIGAGGGGGPGNSGGAIRNSSLYTLTILNARITGNSAGNGGSGARGGGGNGGNTTGAGTAGTGGVGFGGNGGTGGDGGAIWSSGPVVVRDSTISGNRTGTGGDGADGSGGDGGGLGAASQQGRKGGDGFGGSGGRGGRGGAIFASAAVTIERSVISGNQAGAGGAGGTGLGGNGGQGGATAGSGGEGGAGAGGSGGDGGAGGAIYTGSTPAVTIVASSIAGNTTGDAGAGGDGTGGRGGKGGANNGTGWFAGDGTGGTGGTGGEGAGVSSAGPLSATGSLFSDNHAGDGAAGGHGGGGNGGDNGGAAGNGGQGGVGTGGHGGPGGRGGAAVMPAGSLTNTTVTQNSGGSGAAGGSGAPGVGGAAPGGSAGVSNSSEGGDGGAAGGGGLVVNGGAFGVSHATIDANAAGALGAGGTASGSSATPGTAGSAAEGGLGHYFGGTLSLANSIVASNTPFNCSGTIGNGGHDVRFGDTTCPGSSANPLLGALANNGGRTRTQALLPGSPALNIVPASGAGCAATDQRGVSRPRGGACDAGAYEKAAPDVITGGASAISLSGATVAGSVRPNAGSATYHFEYGTTTSYGSSTPTHTLGAGVTPAGVSAGLSGLSPGTTYHYRLVAASANGTTAGADRAFKTASDTTRPQFLSASIRPRRFAVNRSGKRETPVAAVKHGTTFRFTLSEDARVVFTIARAAPGRRVHHRCVKPTARNRSKPACTRYVKPRRFAMMAKAGANRKRFSGRIGRRALRPGAYRATLVATDAAGNHSKPRRLKFRVVRAG